MPAPAYQLTVSPFEIVSHGNRSFSQQITVTNGGRSPVQVSASVRNLAGYATPGHNCAPGAAPGWVSVSPASVTLAPHQAGREVVTVHAPASAPAQDLGVFFAAAPGHGTGLTVAPSVAARLRLDYPGAVTVSPCAAVSPRAAAPVSGSGGFPAALAAGLVLAVLLAALAVWAVLLRRRHAAR